MQCFFFKLNVIDYLLLKKYVQKLKEIYFELFVHLARQKIEEYRQSGIYLQKFGEFFLLHHVVHLLNTVLDWRPLLTTCSVFMSDFCCFIKKFE